MADRIAEADKLCKEATKLSAPSFLSFRLKGEWERATPLWERAAMLYRVSQGNRGQRRRRLSPCTNWQTGGSDDGGGTTVPPTTLAARNPVPACPA